MSFRQLRRTSASLSVALLLGLSGAACGARHEVPTTSNVNQAATASDAAGGGAAANAGAQRVEMGDDVFRPALLNVPAGTKVTWVNKGHKAHTVVSNEKLFDSGLVNIDGEFSHTFDAPGTYLYHCAPHAKMVGQVVVK
jgi:plastocyanin